MKRAFSLLILAVIPAPAQQASIILARLDRFAPTFTAARAAIRSVNHTAVINEDETELGVLAVKKYGPGKLRFRVDFNGENAFTVVLGDQLAEVYHPKIDEIQEYDIRKYRDIAQKMFLLGFGTAGRELAANFEIRDVRSENVESQGSTHLELVPKSADVRRQLAKVELWISDKNACPLQQKFWYPDASFRTVTFSGLQINPNLPSSTFDLPKSAKRVRN
jgi:outer membrane lipoprotein-sorting protein